MSAWRIGSEAAVEPLTPQAPEETPQAPEQTRSDTGASARDELQQILNRLIKWIPGDTLAIYLPAVTALAASDNDPSLVLLIVMVIVTPLFAIGAAFAQGRGKVTRRVVVAALLAAIAFAIWSMSVPESGWQQWDVIADNTAAFAIGAAIVGVLFGYLAEGITLRVSARS